MFLKPNSLEEYKKRHSEIWPELKLLFKEAGVGAYHIYHDPQTKVGIHERSNGNQSRQFTKTIKSK